jgi:hypothetical protein
VAYVQTEDRVLVGAGGAELTSMKLLGYPQRHMGWCPLCHIYRTGASLGTTALSGEYSIDADAKVIRGSYRMKLVLDGKRESVLAPFPRRGGRGLVRR